MTTQIDLSKLPPPDAVEELDAAAIRDAILDDLAAETPLLASIVESDPAYAVVTVCAYRESLLRQRINDAIRAVLLSTAWDTNLDHIGQGEGVVRKSWEDETGEVIEEEDDDYRGRVHLERRSRGAGVREAYESAALAADERVGDAYAYRVSAAVADVEWAPAVGVDPGDYAAIDAAVEAAVTDPAVRALTDQVTATQASPLAWTVVAHLHLEPGPDPATTLAAAEASIAAYGAKVRVCRGQAPLSGIHAALTVTGVAKVEITTPASDVEAGVAEFPELGTVTLTSEVASWLS